MFLSCLFDIPHRVTDQVLTWMFVFVGCASIYMLAQGLYMWPRGEKCRCHGPRLGWRGILKCRWFFWRGTCWYNLNTLPIEGGVVRCPECGTQQNSKGLRRDGRRFRFIRVGLLLAMISIAVGYVGPYQNGTWPRSIPTYPLVMLSNSSLGNQNRNIRREIQDRVSNGIVSGHSATKLSDLLVLDLRNDHIRWNAGSASGMLLKLWPASREALEREILVGDRQSRSLAANHLRSKSKKPSTQLLIGCVSDLRDDGREGRYNYCIEGNARSAMYYLVRWSEPASPYLQRAMESDDVQQRFFSSGSARVCRK